MCSCVRFQVLKDCKHADIDKRKAILATKVRCHEFLWMACTCGNARHDQGRIPVSDGSARAISAPCSHTMLSPVLTMYLYLRSPSRMFFTVTAHHRSAACPWIKPPPPCRLSCAYVIHSRQEFRLRVSSIGLCAWRAHGRELRQCMACTW